MLREKLKGLRWTAPASVPGDIPCGDMPGDRVRIGAVHIAKANTLFPVLLGELEKLPGDRAVVCVCGGSGVGKSEIASLLAHYLRSAGVGAYVLSGDNYPHRIPMYNDAERLRVYREGAIRGMAAQNALTPERLARIMDLRAAEKDADSALLPGLPWLEPYFRCGRARLAAYLGSGEEIDFDEIGGIVGRFKNGEKEIWLRRMGRDAAALWYEKMDFSRVDVLLIEWTHGNSGHYAGVDIPILLHSTPQETLAHRRARNRDGAPDSPFTAMVLELEQAMLAAQAPRARIILSQAGELLDFGEYRRRTEESHG